jgi:hypothetical protein
MTSTRRPSNEPPRNTTASVPPASAATAAPTTHGTGSQGIDVYGPSPEARHQAGRVAVHPTGIPAVAFLGNVHEIGAMRLCQLPGQPDLEAVFGASALAQQWREPRRLAAAGLSDWQLDAALRVEPEQRLSCLRLDAFMQRTDQPVLQAYVQSILYDMGQSLGHALVQMRQGHVSFSDPRAAWSCAETVERQGIRHVVLCGGMGRSQKARTTLMAGAQACLKESDVHFEMTWQDTSALAPAAVAFMSKTQLRLQAQDRGTLLVIDCGASSFKAELGQVVDEAGRFFVRSIAQLSISRNLGRIPDPTQSELSHSRRREAYSNLLSMIADTMQWAQQQTGSVGLKPPSYGLLGWCGQVNFSGKVVESDRYAGVLDAQNFALDVAQAMGLSENEEHFPIAITNDARLAVVANLVDPDHPALKHPTAYLTLGSGVGFVHVGTTPESYRQREVDKKVDKKERAGQTV